MPAITAHQSATLTKLLLVADSGSGKTGAMLSLVKAGYKLAILDFDGGLDWLANAISKECPDKAGNVHFVTCTDKLKQLNGKVVPAGQPRAMQNALKYLDDWKIKDTESGEVEDLGPPGELGPDWIVVIDSLTFACKAALRAVLHLNGRSAGRPQIQDWGQAMGLIEDMLALLYGSSFNANVIVTSHITSVEDDDGNTLKLYPAALGKKLPPTIGRYFNSLLTIVRKGGGRSEKRYIATTSQGLLECKASAPGIPPELPIETGLADYFAAVQTGGEKKNPASSKT